LESAAKLNSLRLAGAEAADYRSAASFRFGGTNRGGSRARVWPNGTVRAEFGVKADQDVVTEQRLKASCPFLFAYNGKQMEFVKDAVPWGSAIGLRINTLGSAQIAATGEWYKIGRDQLVPHDGYYDIRVTAELWEVYYYDYLALMPSTIPWARRFLSMSVS
jgi:hypothetical protein